MSGAIAAFYRGYIAGGKRFYWGFRAGFTPGEYTTGAAMMKLCASEKAINSSTPITFGRKTPAALLYQFGLSEKLHADGNIYYATFTSPPAGAAVLATADNDANRISGFALPPGSKDADGVTFGGACGCFGFIYSTTAFTARGIAALKEIIEFNPAAVSGVVRDAGDQVAQRTLRVYDRSSGLLAGETLSSAATGAYVFFVSKGVEVNVVCLDDGAGDVLNDFITRVTPV